MSGCDTPPLDVGGRRVTKSLNDAALSVPSMPPPDLKTQTDLLESAAVDRMGPWGCGALYRHRSEAIVEGRPVAGVEIVRFDALISCAIAAPLEMWCLRLYLRTTGDDEADLQRLLHEAPWLRHSLDLAGVIVEELQRHRYAILACNSEALARGLAEASRPQRRSRVQRLHVQIYSPSGLCVEKGDASINDEIEEICLAPTLETERLRLRSLRSADFNDYAALYSDSEVLRYLTGAGSQPWDRGRAWRHLSFVRGHWLMAGTGSWAVEHKETGAFIGVIGFSEPEGWPGLELAWILGRRWWGFGYATEGAQAVLEWAFTQWNRDWVISLIHPDNQGSIRVAERLGEILQGRLMHNGREVLCYGIDRETYLQKRETSRGR